MPTVRRAARRPRRTPAQREATGLGPVASFAGDAAGELSAGLGARSMSSFREGDVPSVPSPTLSDALLACDMPRWRLPLNGSKLADKSYFGTCP